MSTMVEILEGVIATRGGRRQSGLCFELAKADDLDADRIHAVFETWEHFSGNLSFPVPDPDRPGDPEAAEDIYCREGGGGPGLLGRSVRGATLEASRAPSTSAPAVQ